MKLAQFALSRREPQYVARTAEIRALETSRAAGTPAQELLDVLRTAGLPETILEKTGVASVLFANRPGDGSAREQAASCQRVLGGGANICYAFATKRYRSNCINWGMLPLTVDENPGFDYAPGDWLFLPDVRKRVAEGATELPATVITKTGAAPITLHLPELTEDERQILLAGCLMNFYAENNRKKAAQP